MLWCRVRARTVPPLGSATARDWTRVPRVPDRPVTMDWKKRFSNQYSVCGSNHTKSWHCDTRFVNILAQTRTFWHLWSLQLCVSMACPVQFAPLYCGSGSRPQVREHLILCTYYDSCGHLFRYGSVFSCHFPYRSLDCTVVLGQHHKSENTCYSIRTRTVVVVTALCLAVMSCTVCSTVLWFRVGARPLAVLCTPTTRDRACRPLSPVAKSSVDWKDENMFSIRRRPQSKYFLLLGPSLK